MTDTRPVPDLVDAGDSQEPVTASGPSRRTVLTGAGVGVGVAAVAGVGFAAGRTTAPGDGSSADQVVPFRGARQAGIITAAQDRLHFASFDVITDKRDELVNMLKEWTRAAERLTRGEETSPDGAVGLGDYTPPADTGEALGLKPAHLTLTIGFGPSLFGPSASDPKRRDRFGLAARKPKGFDDLPMFAAEKIETNRSYGDICIQACADDPQVAVHAIRNLARIGMGVVAVRWSQLGFGRTSSTSTTQDTPRNLFGFKDGTNNLHAEEPELLDKWVWVDDADNPPAAQWMTGGTYLVARRIRMDIEPWDRANLLEQEQIVGRLKGNGAPLGQHAEFDEPDFDITSYGVPLIPKDSHVRLAHEKHIGVRILRRGYNFTDGSDGFGHLDAGLFFIAFNRNTAKQFVPMQQELSRKDAMTEYLIPNGSATFAIPPGLSDGEYWGQRLFEG
ncbi:deferrochelatase/peroxidase EfeB [Gordonia amarae]|uniref:Deferrochelatase n=2 Tax=Gordonia amarae TaxID=36821 RepID=G7GNZ8_9ACTN|nr:iron uptake transporter deferrochelatase/peroxidase subunit [Gordonia amarae]MCS3878090.1 deferrochelatase/peroxidase EfeB [Gordonia amarae]QHN16773.1 deferrochelatase/peroxidase EfeB [Gordonia amarae]QHN21298.1 deferrochelatase/peroxidase EfeB [Gordonia amarae]QHN30152.1 deferrochelatase/peroxidase EfeB [Gordonia amarae]QHN38925.1 deferrochelatase/peroxidase EfeB [Gordonia amarae]